MKISPLYFAWAGVSVAAVGWLAGGLRAVPTQNPVAVSAPVAQPPAAPPRPGTSAPVSVPPAPQGPPGRIVFDEPGIDFGQVEQGQVFTHEFKVRNTGQGVLRILDVTSTCGCTGAVVGNREIPAGGDSQISVTFKSGTFNGPQQKLVKVKSSDPVQPEASVYVKADVKPTFVFDPPALHFGPMARGEEFVKDITVRDAKGRPFGIEQLTVSHPEVRVAEVPVEGGDGSVHRIRVTAKTTGNPGPFVANVTFKPDRKDAPHQTIVVQGNIQGTVSVWPPSVFFGQVKQDQRFPLQVVTVKTSATAPFQITSVETGDPGLKAVVQDVRPGFEYKVVMTVEQNPAPGNFVKQVKIATSDSALPLTVSCSGVVRKP